MTKDSVSKIIYAHYATLDRVLKLNNKKEMALIMSRDDIKELHGITILAYYYLTGEDLQKAPYKEDEQ